MKEYTEMTDCMTLIIRNLKWILFELKPHPKDDTVHIVPCMTQLKHT